MAYGRTAYVNRVKLYYKNTPANDIPVWAHGVNWYHNPQVDQARSDRFPANFGIEEAWLAVKANRKGGRKPFQWAENLWPRIEERLHMSLPCPLHARPGRESTDQVLLL